MQKKSIIQQRRLSSPAVTPQALAWHSNSLWMGSRDLRRIYVIDVKAWTVLEEMEVPGIPWAAVSTGDILRFTIGEDPDDDRYLRTYVPKTGFSKGDRIACPEFTGSYLSYDGDHLYLSQWYEHRILKLDSSGNILQVINVGAEICGHVFVDGLIYVLRGTENVPRPQYAGGKPTEERFKVGAKQGEEQWWIARINPRDKNPEVIDVAKVPFGARSLTFDGENFWSNHRAAGEIVSFTLPD
jgi:hypothetical protein